MIPIYIYTDPSNLEQGLTYKNFQSHFLEICKSHQVTERALMFSFILYDLENPEIPELLHKNSYWNSLNVISGKYLTVFYIDTGKTEGIRVLKKIDNISETLLSPHLSKNYYSQYPSIIFFQVSNSEVINACYVKIKTESFEATFKEIKYYLENVVEILKGISKENYSNHKEIFELVEQRIKSIKSARVVKQLIYYTKSVKDFLSIFSV